MKKSHGTWHPFSWHCPNCGEVSAGYRNARGMAKAECGKCHAVMVQKMMGRRHNRIDIYAPPKGTDGTGNQTAVC